MKDNKPHLEVTAGLICEKGRVLIARRPAGSHLEGLWEFPGGKQEKGESLEECLEREIVEELGIRIKADKALLRVDYEYETKHISLHVFSCTLLEETPELPESREVMWVERSDLKSFAFPPPDEEIMRLVSSSKFNAKKGYESK